MAGTFPFIALKSCGCVFSDAALRAVVPDLTKGAGAKVIPKDDAPEEAKPLAKENATEVACPNCGKTFNPIIATAIIPVNPPKEVQEVLLDGLLTFRAVAKSSKKRKADKSTKANNDTGSAATLEPPAKLTRISSSSPAPRASPTVNTPASLARSVHEKLAEQEKKRLQAQENMSEAVKAMFKPKTNEKKSGADDFFGRTFTRVSLHSNIHPCADSSQYA